MDTRTLAFTLAAAVLSGILAGLAPAWQCSRPNLTDALKEGGRGGSPAARATAAQHPGGIRSGPGGGPASRRGADGSRIPHAGGQRRTAGTGNPAHHAAGAHRQQVSRTLPADCRSTATCWTASRALPGVRAATAVTALPYSDHSNGRGFTIEGRPVELRSAPQRHVPGDQPRLISSTCTSRWCAGRSCWPRRRPGRAQGGGDLPAHGGSLVEKRIAHRQTHPPGRIADSKAPWLTIVGVVGDIVAQPLRPRTPPHHLCALSAVAAAVDGYRRANRGRSAAARARR